MTEEDIFLLDILAHPDDDAPRLIYADWLSDQDDPRGDLLRTDWELRGLPNAARADFHQQRAELCRAHGWLPYDGLVLTREQFLFAFRMRLAETIAFCAGRELPLRTWELEPRSLLGGVATLHWPYDAGIDWPGMVIELAITRRRLLERKGRAPSRPANSLANGRLLTFDPWVAIGLGQAMTFSAGYFDADNLPPWDTWVMQIPEASPTSRDDPRRVTPHYLVAWVPPAYVARAGVGIETNEEGSLLWMHQVSTPLTRGLRDAGVM
jgi:uncharacterized protein (TIGR02996 family)